MGFNQLLDVLNALDQSSKIKIGLEATGHYATNLKIFLEENNFSYMEFHPLFIKRFSLATTLRRTKTDKVDAQFLASLIESGIVPIVAPLTHDGEGHILNTNADTIASSVAQALAEHYEVTLTFCFEKAGVLRDANDDNSVIPLIDEQEASKLIAEGVIAGGMIPKIENAFDAIRKGVRQVVITHSDNIDGSRGTTIK